MKKRIILLFISIILVFCVIATISSSDQVSNLDFKKCVNTCTREGVDLTKNCNLQYTNDSKQCRAIYTSCVKTATLAKTSKKNCTTDYSTCKKSISLKKVECKNNIINNCNDKCIIKQSDDCSINLKLNKPVCGIDNISYLNECYLAKYNTTKAHDGLCIRNY